MTDISRDRLSDLTDRDFFISRVFEFPRALVFKAWSDPKHLAAWWGPRDFTNPVCEVDFRVGGAYRITMRSPDGIDYPMRGIFRDIVEPERLVMTIDCSEHPAEWHDIVSPGRDPSNPPRLDALQTVTFEDLGGGRTRLSSRTRFETAALRDRMLAVGMQQGWSSSLDKLAAYLARD